MISSDERQGGGDAIAVPVEPGALATPSRRRGRTAAIILLVPCAIVAASAILGLPLHAVVGLAALLACLATAVTGVTRCSRAHGALGTGAVGVLVACLVSGVIAGRSGPPPSWLHLVLGAAALVVAVPLRPTRSRRGAHALLGSLATAAALSAGAVAAWRAP